MGDEDIEDNGFENTVFVSLSVHGRKELIEEYFVQAHTPKQGVNGKVYHVARLAIRHGLNFFKQRILSDDQLVEILQEPVSEAAADIDPPEFRGLTPEESEKYSRLPAKYASLLISGDDSDRGDIKEGYAHIPGVYSGPLTAELAKSMRLREIVEGAGPGLNLRSEIYWKSLERKL